MHESIARTVHPVLTYGLALKEQLRRGGSPVIATEQSALETLLTLHAPASGAEAHDRAEGDGAGGHAENRAGRAGERLQTIRYALVCWLDELFILDSAWETPWNERKLEVSLYGTNDRSWKFWETARRPETRTDGDVLEVLFLCVMLGFRGDLRDRPDELREWVEATRAQLAARDGLDWPYPPESEPPIHVPALHGRDQLRRVVFAGAAVVLASIPVVAFLLVRRLGQ